MILQRERWIIIMCTGESARTPSMATGGQQKCVGDLALSCRFSACRKVKFFSCATQVLYMICEGLQLREQELELIENIAYDPVR